MKRDKKLPKPIELELHSLLDLSGKSRIVYQDIDPEKQAKEMEQLRNEIIKLIEDRNHSRLYSTQKSISLKLFERIIPFPLKKRLSDSQ